MDPFSVHQNDASASSPQPQRQHNFKFNHQTNPMYSHSTSSSDDDDVSSSNSIQSTNKRLDCMLQFLDRKLSAADHNDRRRNPLSAPSFLPEFVAKGGATGIFKPPVRAAVPNSRPPSLELRPHPLRETQIGRFLRNIVATESQLWAAGECGIRFWDFKDLYASWCSVGGEGVARSGEEECAPFRESVWTSPALCLVADEGNRLVWSGHKDGKIRCWHMDPQDMDDNNKWTNHLKESLSWQAHRGPVLSLTVTSYGHSSSFIIHCLHCLCFVFLLCRCVFGLENYVHFNQKYDLSKGSVVGF